jgi:hypothetical protein
MDESVHRNRNICREVLGWSLFMVVVWTCCEFSGGIPDVLIFVIIVLVILYHDDTPPQPIFGLSHLLDPTWNELGKNVIRLRLCAFRRPKLIGFGSLIISNCAHAK